MRILPAGYLTSSEVLLTPLDTLRRKLHLTSSEASSLILQISHTLILGQTRTVAEILELEGPEEEGEEEREGERVGEWITSGDMGIDELLGGGLRMGSITEVAGQS
jgi:DNA repair protein RAD57